MQGPSSPIANMNLAQYCSAPLLQTMSAVEKCTYLIVTAILQKLSLKAWVISRIVNTRMMRRSTISYYDWSKNKDPSFRQELSHLAGHSYETATRYYSVYDTSEQSKKIVSKLEE